MSFTVVIPARYQSSRLPAKPLCEIAGKTMIQRVWEQASQSSASEVVIATDHEAIVEHCQQLGASVVMTAASHESGSDRVYEVCQQRGWDDEAIVINLQGDEPMFPPALIDLLYGNLAANASAGIATLCQPIQSWQQFLDPNVVKVVRDRQDYAHYFSRAPIPWDRAIELDGPTLSNFSEAGNNYELGLAVPPALPQAALRHIGIYAYRVSVLRKFVAWPNRGGSESIECLEQLRALDHGVAIHCASVDSDIPDGIDTPADLDRVRALLANSRSSG